ncbi:MAG TPA: hypothetical protein VK929_13620 [Longimicrobiales bacterium]|nr:hypothetical protein [Longimicrobiales bacterium]
MTYMDRLLRELDLFDSAGAPVLSLYLPVESETGLDMLTRATRLVRSLATDMPEAAQADLARELEEVRDYVGSLVAAPAGLAIFCCARRGFFRVARLSERVHEYACWQPEPETGPLRQVAGSTGLLTPVA